MTKVAFTILCLALVACTAPERDDPGDDTPSLPGCSELDCLGVDACGGYELGTQCACEPTPGDDRGMCVVDGPAVYPCATILGCEPPQLCDADGVCLCDDDDDLQTAPIACTVEVERP